MTEINLILKNGKITTLDPKSPEVQAIAIADGKVVCTGTNDDVMKLATATSKVVDLNGRRVIPGLNDSHLHIIRGGLNYNMELRWEGVPSVADAL
ncbi:amidohydrolase family protein, partial [Acinetobacter baumannii]